MARFIITKTITQTVESASARTAMDDASLADDWQTEEVHIVRLREEPAEPMPHYTEHDPVDPWAAAEPE